MTYAGGSGKQDFDAGMFDFATNGDGSGISVNEDEIITSFPIDFS